MSYVNVAVNPKITYLQEHGKQSWSVETSEVVAKLGHLGLPQKISDRNGRLLFYRDPQYRVQVTASLPDHMRNGKPNGETLLSHLYGALQSLETTHEPSVLLKTVKSPRTILEYLDGMAEQSSVTDIIPRFHEGKLAVNTGLAGCLANCTYCTWAYPLQEDGGWDRAVSSARKIASMVKNNLSREQQSLITEMMPIVSDVGPLLTGHPVVPYDGFGYFDMLDQELGPHKLNVFLSTLQFLPSIAQRQTMIARRDGSFYDIPAVGLEQLIRLRERPDESLRQVDVWMGVESAIPDISAQLGKGYGPNDVLHALDQISKAGMGINVMFIQGIANRFEIKRRGSVAATYSSDNVVQANIDLVKKFHQTHPTTQITVHPSIMDPRGTNVSRQYDITFFLDGESHDQIGRREISRMQSELSGLENVVVFPRYEEAIVRGDVVVL